MGRGGMLPSVIFSKEIRGYGKGLARHFCHSWLLLSKRLDGCLLKQSWKVKLSF